MANEEQGDIISLRVLGASSTALAVASERNFELVKDGEVIDISAKGDQIRRYVAGLTNITLNVDGLYVDSDDGISRLTTQLEGGSSVTIQIFRNGSRDSSATAFITSLNQAHSYEDAATYTATFQISGAISS